MFRNGILKKTSSSYKDTMENGTPPSSSDSEMASKEKKNLRSKFKEQTKMHCYYPINQDDALFNNRYKSSFVLSTLQTMLNFEVDRLSIHQSEYEMDRTYFPVDYNFF